MVIVGDIVHAQKALLADIEELQDRLRSLAKRKVENIEAGYRFLRAMRSAVYEDLNQLQHEHLLLAGLRWLSEIGFGQEVDWSWNPRQTGGGTEPDIQGTRQGEIIVSVEATTSTKPVGVIDARMKATLIKLNAMLGSRFYFVTTPSMERRAKTKVQNLNLDIKVILLNLDSR